MPTISCATCGDSFSVPQCRIKLGAKYCSVKCRGLGARTIGPVSGCCTVCGSRFERSSRSKIPKQFCCHSCYAIERKASRKSNTNCRYCGTAFWLKPSEKRGKRPHGFFCSNVCYGKFKSVVCVGQKNSNWRGGEDSLGYRTYVPSSLRGRAYSQRKLHQAICCEILGIDAIPRGLHVHHRDCDPRNNMPSNLAVLTISDHKWLHKQFGIAPLWAYMRGRVSSSEMKRWSDDPDRAERVLMACVESQSPSDLTIERCRMLDPVAVDDLPETARGDGAFGSTGR